MGASPRGERAPLSSLPSSQGVSPSGPGSSGSGACGEVLGDMAAAPRSVPSQPLGLPSVGLQFPHLQNEGCCRSSPGDPSSPESLREGLDPGPLPCSPHNAVLPFLFPARQSRSSRGPLQRASGGLGLLPAALGLEPELLAPLHGPGGAVYPETPLNVPPC